MTLQRIAMGVEYDGSAYYGWQQQDNLPSIQGVLEAAISKVADEPIKVQGAGRTDAGVHAMGQVLHFDTAASRSNLAWLLGANRYLPRDVRVLWAKPVTSEFHARYSAVARTYRYSVYHSMVASAIFYRQAMWCRYELDTAKMQEAASYLLGEHDFTSFRGAGCQSNTPFRNVIELTISYGGAMLNFKIKANAFLLHMVRNIVGSLLLVGVGKHQPSWIKEVLEAKDRRLAGPAAPAKGLYLMQVDYPAKLLF